MRKGFVLFLITGCYWPTQRMKISTQYYFMAQYTTSKNEINMSLWSD